MMTTYWHTPMPGDEGYPDFDHGDYDPRDDFEYGICPACGEWADYCQGHGEIGDPQGFDILTAHDAGDHSGCHPRACDAST